MKIIRNSAKCKACGDHIVSKYRHDMVGCSCYIKSREALHLWFKNKELEYSGNIPPEVYKEAPETLGIAVDGGSSYLKRTGDPDLVEDTSIIG